MSELREKVLNKLKDTKGFHWVSDKEFETITPLIINVIDLYKTDSKEDFKSHIVELLEKCTVLWRDEHNNATYTGLGYIAYILRTAYEYDCNPQEHIDNPETKE